MARGRQKSQGSESGGEGGKEKEDRSNRLILKEETVLNVRTLLLYLKSANCHSDIR